jgi:hypothetical protein
LKLRRRVTAEHCMLHNDIHLGEMEYEPGRTCCIRTRVKNLEALNTREGEREQSQE